jgi:hypothetical protein
MDLKFYRTNSCVGVSQWDAQKRVMLEVSPAIENNVKGQPKPGEHRFAYDKAIRISFTVDSMLTASYTLIGMSQGVEMEYQKFADMSKSQNATGDEKKSLKISASDKGGFFVGMISGKERVNIVLSPEELYALGKYLEFSAQKYIAMPNDIAVAAE